MILFDKLAIYWNYYNLIVTLHNSYAVDFSSSFFFSSLFLFGSSGFIAGKNNTS